MVRENKVHTATVNIKVITQILASHRCTLAVPTRETIAPRRWPTHDMFWHSTLPKGKVNLITLLTNTCQLTRIVYHVGDVTTRKNAIVVVFVVFLYIKVDTSIAFISITIGKNLLYKFFLLNDMTSCMRFDAWWKNIERTHSIMIAIGIMLRNLHWLQLLKTCLLLNLVITFVSIMLQMAHVRDVTNITNLVPYVFKIAEKNIKGDSRTCVSEVWIAINSWSTDIHSYVRSCNRLEEFLLTMQCIVNY